MPPPPHTHTCRQVNIESILQNSSIILLGPWYGDGALANGAFVLRFSVFLPAANASTWDIPPSELGGRGGAELCTIK